MMKLFRLWTILVAVIFAPMGWAAYETEEPVDFSLPQLGGEAISLSDFRGEWVVVNYWATWCAPCRKEIPDLSRLHTERSDLTVLGLAFEELDDSGFAEFLEEFEVTYPILKVDVYAPPEPFGAPMVLPTTIILDKQGRAVKAFMGPVTREAIEAYVDAAGDG